MADKPYMPSNGGEGEWFMSKWCDKCGHDDPDNENYCPIIGNSMAGLQPDEWVDRDGTPMCTAFTTEAHGEPRCNKTMEMF